MLKGIERIANELSIQKKFQIILSINILLAGLSIFGLVEVAKTGHFTFLEREHVEGVLLANMKLDEFERSLQNGASPDNTLVSKSSSDPKNTGLKGLVFFIKEQPIQCLAAVNFFEDLLFRVLGFGEALDLCIKDIKDNDIALKNIDNYLSGRMDATSFIANFRNSLKEYNTNSERFAVLIPEIRNFVVTMMLTTIIVITLLSSGISYLILKSLKEPLMNLISTVKEIEDHNKLSLRIKESGSTEIMRVQRYLNNIFEKFERIIQQSNKLSQTLLYIAHELQNMTEQSVSRIDNQSRETEQAAHMMSQISLTLNETARNTQQGADLTDKVSEQTEQGGVTLNLAIDSITNMVSKVSDSTDAILLLEQSSQEIGNIVDVIGSVAGQTNILALNAGIEAARAGEHGHGFAVVADEVRTLAQKTRESTQEINDIVERLQGGAKQAANSMIESKRAGEHTIQQATEAGQVLQSVTSAMDQIRGLTTQIASATHEQSTTVEEINRNIQGINDVTKDTKSKIQKNQEQALVLHRFAGELKSLISIFNV